MAMHMMQIPFSMASEFTCRTQKKSKGKAVPVLNQAPCHQDVQGNG
jgi:hypothetical protein